MIFYDDISDCTSKRILRFFLKNSKNRENYIPSFHILVFVQKIPIQNCFWENSFSFVNRFSFFKCCTFFGQAKHNILRGKNFTYNYIHVRYLENMYEKPISETRNCNLGLYSCILGL